MSEAKTTEKTVRKRNAGAKLLASIIPILLMLVVVLTAISSYNDWVSLQADEVKELQFLLENYNSIVTSQTQTVGGLALGFADRNDIKQLLNAGNREELQKLLVPAFDSLNTEYNIGQLYIEDPQGNVLLRAHNPSQFGDDVTYRPTTAAALRIRKTVSGIEIDSDSIGIHGVAPIEERGRMLGLADVVPSSHSSKI